MGDIARFLDEKKKIIDSKIREHLPEKVSKDYLDNILGETRYEYDLESINKVLTEPIWAHIAIKTDLEGFFDENLGEIQFVWEEREKVQIISFAIGKLRVWISIDKKVIRTEILRIIDACTPIVKKYTDNIEA